MRFFNSLDQFVALGFRMFLRVQGSGRARADLLFQTLVVRLIELRRRDCALRLADLAARSSFNGGANLLDFGVAEFDGVDHRLFFHFLRARLDHHDAVGGADDHDVQQAVAHLRYKSDWR